LRRAALAVVAFVMAIASFACRDILGIADHSTVGDGAVTDGLDLDQVTPGDGGVVTTNCGASLTELIALDGIGVLAIAADDKAVFFTNMQDTGGGDVIGWVNGARTDVTLGTTQPIDVQLDSDNVYWTGFDALNVVNSAATIHAWSRTTNQTTDVPIGDDAGLTAGQLALDSTHVYFGEWRTDTAAGVYALSLPLGGTNTPILLASNLSSSPPTRRRSTSTRTQDRRRRATACGPRLSTVARPRSYATKRPWPASRS